MFRKLAATVAVSTALISSPVWSLGLGDIEANSALNQPLKAEINLLSSKGFDEQDLQAKIASFEAYTKFGVVRQADHNNMRFEVFTRRDGSKAIRVYSSDPIKEPFLNFLVELNWPQGKLLREYTLLLDPPTFNKTSPTTTNTQTSTATRSNTVTNTSRPSSNTNTTSSSSTRRSAPAFDDSSWTVQRGDTLWRIASRVRPNGVTVQQTLAALYRNNPNAFINNDINRLKAGATLSVPATSQIDDISQSSALSDLRSSTPQNDAPLDVRKAVDETTVDDSSSQGGRLTIASVDESSLNSSGGSQVDGQNPDAMQGEIDSLREAVETLKLQNQQLKEQLSESADASDTGLAVEDDALAVLSGSAETNSDDLQAIDSDTNNDIASDAIDEQSDAIDAAATDMAANNSSADPVDSEQNQVSQATPAVQEPAKPVSQPMKSSEKAFYEGKNFWWYVGGGLLALLAAIAAFLFMRNRREDDEGEGLVPNFGNAKVNEPNRDSFLSGDKLAQPEQESDPIGEADILIARGRLEEAEGILEAALDKDPADDQVRVKLMEVYASQQKVDEFKALKRALPDGFDHDSELGLKVASLSGLIAPLEQSSEKNYMSSDDFELPTEDEIFGDYDSDGNTEVPDVDVSSELENEEVVETLDTTLDEAEQAVEDIAEEVVDSNEPLEFEVDLSEFEKELDETSQPEIQQSHDDNALDFNLDANDDEAEVSTDDSPALDLSDELDQADGEGLSDDEAATKLELARAYIEMGDEEAAKDILLEVQKEGNAAQSEEAAQLLSEL
ncbi:MAG: FimV family protein [Kangiellaceae bacterium]|nr:FimV family protein [Kangiellaceae bacterium]